MGCAVAFDATSELLGAMNAGLHALSQPVTALLCLLEYGSGLEAGVEVKQVMQWSVEASERLRETVTAMQVMVQEQARRRHDEYTTDMSGRERGIGQPHGNSGEHGRCVAGEATGESDEPPLAGP
jgi:hypothetical protein